MRVGNDSHSVRQSRSKFNFHAHGALHGQVKESFFGKIRSDVKGVQRVAFGVIFARNVVAFVSVFFAGSGKEAHECLDVLTAGIVWFQWSNRLSVSIKMYRNFAQGKILKVVWILRVAPIEGIIIDASDYESCWELLGKQLLVISVHVTRRDDVCLAYNASDGIFSQSRLERFSVSQEDRRTQLHLAY